MKKIIVLVLVFVMIFSVVACAKTEEKKPAGENTEQVQEKIWDKKEYDFDGFQFVILGGAATGVVYDRDGSDLDVDSITGNEVLDAVYNRNRLIEETYNCTILHVQADSSFIQTALLTGSDEDVSLISIKVNSQYSFIEKELLLDLYDEDLTHPSRAGTYLAALCHFATVMGEDPVTVTFNGGLSAAEATVLKQVASDVIFGK